MTTDSAWCALASSWRNGGSSACRSQSGFARSRRRRARPIRRRTPFARALDYPGPVQGWLQGSNLCARRGDGERLHDGLPGDC